MTAAVVDVLSRHLPSSRPQPVRAAESRRIGVLIATDQQDVAVMQAASAERVSRQRLVAADTEHHLISEAVADRGL